MNLEIKNLFDLSRTVARDLFEGKRYPWEVLPEIREAILKLGPTLPEEEYEQVAPQVWVARDARVAPTAVLGGPLIVDHGAEIRHCAFIRGSAIVGRNAVVGNSTELKNCVLFDGVQVPHFNYVGDAVLGERAHMGAGAVTSNVKSDKSLVTVRTDDRVIATNLRKFGAMLGDYAEIGCNSVLCPGAVIGRGTTVYPTSCVRGFVPEHSVYKGADRIVPKWDETKKDGK